jgi:hypothetical protein
MSIILLVDDQNFQFGRKAVAEFFELNYQDINSTFVEDSNRPYIFEWELSGELEIKLHRDYTSLTFTGNEMSSLLRLCLELYQNLVPSDVRTLLFDGEYTFQYQLNYQVTVEDILSSI